MKIVFVVALLGVVGAKIEFGKSKYFYPNDPSAGQQRPTRSSIYTPDNALSWVDKYYERSYAPQSYSFSYDVDDGYNNYGHQQESDGSVTTGSYRVLLPDGRTQIVNFRADKNGYVADVRYEVSIYKPSPYKASAANSWPAGGWTAFKPAKKLNSYKADLISAFGLKTKEAQAVIPSTTYKTPTTQYRKANPTTNRVSPWTAFKVTEAPFYEAKAVYEAVTAQALAAETATTLNEKSASSNKEPNPQSKSITQDVTIPFTITTPSSQTHRAYDEPFQVPTSVPTTPALTSSYELSFSTTSAPIYGTRVNEDTVQTPVRPTWTDFQPLVTETVSYATTTTQPETTTKLKAYNSPVRTPWTAFRQWPVYPTDAEYVAPTTYKPAVAYTFPVETRPLRSHSKTDVTKTASSFNGKLPTPLIFRTRKV